MFRAVLYFLSYCIKCLAFLGTRKEKHLNSIPDQVSWLTEQITENIVHYVKIFSMSL